MIPQTQPDIDGQELAAATEVLKSGWLSEGKQTDRFSQMLLDLIGCKHGVFAPNGTLALALGMLAAGVKPGSEVLVPDLTFYGSASAAWLIGAKPVPVDVDRDLQIDASKIEEKITDKTSAIMPVHLYGIACNMPAIMQVARDHNLLVIEDACQGIAVSCENKHVGSWGDVGCFSFFSDKTITTGEGGYVCTNSEKVYEQLLVLRNQGRRKRGSFVHDAWGVNFRITDLQAAIGVVQMTKLQRIVFKKRNLMEVYRKELQRCQAVSLLGCPTGVSPCWFRAVLFAKHTRGQLAAHLEKHGVQTRDVFVPLHRQATMKSKGRFPRANQAYLNGICLPIYPALTTAQVRNICRLIRDFYE